MCDGEESAIAKRPCANGLSCIHFKLRGEPARLSVYNKNDICFSCEEHSIRIRPNKRNLVWSAQKER